MGPTLRCKHSWIHLGELCTVPWVPEVFLACGRNFRCWPKADTTSVVGRSHERQPRLKSLWHPGTQVRWLATCFAALLRNGFKSYVALFTTYVQTRLHKAGCYKLRDYWLLIFSHGLQQPVGLSQDKLVWFVSAQTHNIAIQQARFAAIMLQNRSHVFVACFRCTFTWRLAFWLRLCSHHNG